MSKWIEVKDETDVEYDLNTDELNILYKSDNDGNCYISIKLSTLLNAVNNKIWEKAATLDLSGYDMVTWVRYTKAAAFEAPR